MNMGWKCPGCNRIHAPHIDECKACNARIESAVIFRDGNVVTGAVDTGLAPPANNQYVKSYIAKS